MVDMLIPTLEDQDITTLEVDMDFIKGLQGKLKDKKQTNIL